ncbi:hypothetical protein GCM10010329_03560 [Streptomyces spiroverticillatus]|uniref:Uncharacterized protein n=1 Tax=Streptomyces finlayi TaxID=67296 RepID=A0A918WSM1_9ACTN|nr:hypothetical protein GCM10010329_03560 [Streptomyces spiroverticillatus]GHC78368.1 hypothetical protein GCM10010334_03540 [Streptomyces finlayi]
MPCCARVLNPSGRAGKRAGNRPGIHGPVTPCPHVSCREFRPERAKAAEKDAGKTAEKTAERKALFSVCFGAISSG